MVCDTFAKFFYACRNNLDDPGVSCSYIVYDAM